MIKLLTGSDHAFQAPPGSQTSSRGEAKDSALHSSRDAGLLEPPERPQGSQPPLPFGISKQTTTKNRCVTFHLFQRNRIRSLEAHSLRRVIPLCFSFHSHTHPRRFLRTGFCFFFFNPYSLVFPQYILPQPNLCSDYN